MKSPPRTAETHGAFLAGEASASPAILNYGKMKPVVAKVLRKNAQGNHRGTTRIMSAIFIPVGG